MTAKNILKDVKSLNIAARQLTKEKNFWLEKLSGEFDRSHFLYDHRKSAAEKKNKDIITFTLHREITERLKKISSGSYSKIHMILTAALAALLTIYTGNNDLIVGTSIDKQDIDAVLLNTILPLRVALTGDITFKELILKVKKTIDEAIENQNYPIQSLVSKLDLTSTGDEFPLFDVAIILENLQDKKYIEHLNNSVIFSFLVKDQSVEGEVEYRTQLYKRKSIERIVDHFIYLLRDTIFNPDRKIDDIDLLTSGDKKRLIAFNRTKVNYPADKVIHELFEGQVTKSPDRTSVEEPDTHRSLSYRELNARADQLANRLRNKGVTPGSIVGILSEKSIEVIVAILGVLKAGGAYLPIDINYPEKRKKYVLEDSEAKLLLIRQAQGKSFDWEGETLVFGDIEPGRENCLKPGGSTCRSSDLAYIIYTSGSTGKPKGVMVEHRSLVNYILCAARNYVKDERVRFPLFTSIAFDLTITSIFTPLLTGNTVVVYGEREIGNIIEKIIDDNLVEVIKLTPSHLYLIQDKKIRANASCIKRFIVGGERLDTQLARDIQKNFNGNLQIYNEYGPTEAAVGCMIYEFNAEKDKGTSVPIGTPQENLQIFLLNRNQKPVPVGAVGEIYIAGAGVARGYLKRPELTSDIFVPNPFTPGTMMYRTGDLGRWLVDDDLNIEFLGRKDHQVKIRGFRVELGEIESCLLQHEDIKEAVVIVTGRKITDSNIHGDENEKREKNLCAYVVSDKKISNKELNGYLAGKLPHYMLPSYIVQLDAIPLTPNGKVEKKSLPEPDEWTEIRTEYQAPRNEVEQILVKIWQDVLGVDKIGIDDSYFSLGGDSINAIQIAARLQAFKLKLELKHLYRYPSIRELGNYVKSLKRDIDQGIIQGEVKLTPIQEWFFQMKLSAPHHFNQAVMFTIPHGLDENTIKRIFTRIIEHHDALRLTFKKENGRVIQINQGLDTPLSLQVFDFRNREDGAARLEDKVNEIQASIDLENGPLMKLGLFYLDAGNRLIIVIHHLAVDGVSWRIIFEDIETLWQQCKNGEQLALPPKTDSFKLWAETLSEYADSNLFLKERTYWTDLESREIEPIKKDFKEENNFIKDTRQLSFSLDKENTALLLTTVNEVFGTEINDILLTALGLGIKKTFGNPQAVIELEGHGREEIFKNVDIKRTVGWFTAVYPVVLDFTHEHNGHKNNLSRHIKKTKENLRRVPDKGIGYGILKYLTRGEWRRDIDFKLNPRISFNYLGQIDTDVDQMSFAIAEESVGNRQDVNGHRRYLLNINGIVTDKRLVISIIYNKKQFKTRTIEKLLANYHEELNRIIAYCSSKQERELTPSDLTYRKLSIEKVEQMQKQFALEDIYPLSPMQEGMLFHALYDKNASTYFEQASYRLHGDLDIRAVKESLNELFKRHEVLRTVFIYEDVERPLQVVLKDRRVDFLFEDIRKIGLKTRNEREIYIKEFKERDCKRSFNLDKDVLMRVTVLQAEESEYEFTWSFHHILMDGWCTTILVSEFFEVYTGILDNRGCHLPDKTPYRFFINWLEKQDKEISRSYWAEYLEGYDQQASVPGLNQFKKEREVYKDEQVILELEKEKINGLRTLAGKNKVTLNTIIQVVWGIILGNYTGKQDVVFGEVVSGRPSEIPGVEAMVGLFINTIPVRILYHPETVFNDLLKEVQDRIIGGERHHYFPLAEIQSTSTLKHNLLDHIIVYENYPIAENLDGMMEEDEETNRVMPFRISDTEVFEQSNYDFNILVSPGDRFAVIFKYNAHAYAAEFIEKVSMHFKNVINQCLQNEKVLIGEITFLSEEEKYRLLVDFNDTETEYPGNKTIQQLFEEQVERTPGNIVIKENTSHLQVTYREFNKQSDRLACLLRKQGVETNTIVGIMVKHSIKMTIGILGILKAGGTYLPIDPDYPEERKQYMLKDSTAKVLVTTNPLAKEGAKDFVLTSVFAPSSSTLTSTWQVSATSLAYVIYTSGTTGWPKGAVIEHRSVINTLLCRKESYNLNPEAVCMQLFSYAFDGFVTSFFTPIISGAAVIFPGEEGEKDIREIKDAVVNHGVTHFISIPLLCRAIIESLNKEEAARLKVITLAGDKLYSNILETIRQKNKNIEIVNEYGVTEVSVMSTMYRHQEKDEVIKIGKPTRNTKIYILDKDMRLLPVGVTGEMCISGSGLARGYLNNPELTAEKFVIREPERPLIPTNDRLYKTGDQARWLPEGNLEFFGRIDHQVKIRGFRIESGEIEKQLLRHPHVKEAVVSAWENENGDKFLSAYYVPENGLTLLPEILRNDLSKELPVYMLPYHFVQLDHIPLTFNGKIDRNALPDPVLNSKTDYKAPKNDIEKKLTSIWQEVLGIEKIGINDNFFQVGGDSIKTIQIASRMRAFGYQVEMKEFFQHPTISRLAPLVKKIARIPDQGVVTGIVPLTPIQKWFFENNLTTRNHFNQAIMLYSDHQKGGGFSEDVVRTVFTEIMHRHDALRMTYSIKNGDIVQVCQGMNLPLSLRVYDFRNYSGDRNVRKVLEEKANQLQASINLENGPLMKLGLFHLDDGDRLLIVIHHLVIDGVSWRILLEDLDILFQRYSKDKPLVLPLKTDSFKTWSEKLFQYANSKAFLKEKTYWEKLESQEVQRIKKDFDQEENYTGYTDKISFSLGEEETNRLLTKVNNAFNTEINDILLTALGMGIKKTFGINRVLIALEGHGREEFLKDIDISRTVGWFTVIYPILLDFSYNYRDIGDKYGLARQIKEVKEALHQVPNKGIGYGIFRYLSTGNPNEFTNDKLSPQVIFNYLGQFDTDIDRESFGIAEEPVGNTSSMSGKQSHEIIVSCIIIDKRLTMSLSYNRKQYERETIEELAQQYKTKLTSIISYCSSREARELTPSDFTYSKLSVEALEHLQSKNQIKDIYTLTPMQEGMVFHALFEKNTSTYFEQLSYRIHGHLDVVVVEKSLNELFKRHDVLRIACVFKEEGIDRPIQLVLKDRQVEFFYEKISKKREKIEDFKKRDRERQFDLSKDVLMRVAILQLDNSEYEFIWSYHHILMDGWSVGILIAEYLDIYRSFLENRSYVLPVVKPYWNYIKWLENRDKKKSKDYWLNYLLNYEKMAGVPREKAPEDVNGYKNEWVSFTLDRKKTVNLNQLAGKNQVTLNTLVQVVWGVLLSRYNYTRDVVFGAVVSGRPAEIEDVESMIGLFINTIPVRIRHNKNTMFSQLLKNSQENALQSEPHHYYPLYDIQADSVLKYKLLDHIMVFENFPIAEQISGIMDRSGENREPLPFKISNVDVFEQTNYDFNISIAPRNQLTVKFYYNSNAYPRNSVEKISKHFNRIIHQVIKDEPLPVGEITLLSEEETHQVLFEFNNTRTGYPKDKTIHELFEVQVEKTPDHIAVVGKTFLHSAGEVRNFPPHRIQLSYKKLNECGNQLARFLRKRGCQHNSIIPIMMESSSDMIIGIMGILKAGGAYLPISPDIPINRQISILEDSRASNLLTETNAVSTSHFTLLKGLYRRRLTPHVTGVRPQITRLDDLPFADRSLVDYDKYMNRIGQAWVTDSIAILATRGCPYKCAYCHKIWPKKHIFRSAENIFAEVEMYYKMGVRRFVIIDDIFNLNIKNSTDFFRLIIENGLKLQIFFPNGVRGDLLTKEYIDLMVEAGTVSMALALETASPRLQKLVGKNLNLERFRENLEYLCEKHPHVISELFTMHGFPTETKEEALKTLDFIRDIKWLHFPYINILRIYSNTDMYQLAVENGISSKAIFDSENLYFHEVPETLPFAKSFTAKMQTNFLNEYFLSKQRLLYVLPYQMKVMTEGEIIHKYNSYLPYEISCLEDLLRIAGIPTDEPMERAFLDERITKVSNLYEKTKACFIARKPDNDALKVLLLDLSQFFSPESNNLDEVFDPPLGLMAVMSYVNHKFGSAVNGRIAKSRIDFDNYVQLKQLLKEFQPDVIGIRTMTYYREFFHKTAARIRQWGIESPIIVGGPYATSNYQTILQDMNVDIAVLGEGEVTFSEIIEKMIKNGRSLPGEKELMEIPGIAFIQGRTERSKAFSSEIILLDELSNILSENSGKNLGPVNHAVDLAYVIFTSGTTANPKGVMVNHRSVVNLLHWFGNNYQLKPGTNVMQLTDFTFDPSIEDIFGTLVHGGTLYTRERDIMLDRKKFHRYINRHEIHVIDFVPTALNELLGVGDEQKPKSLRTVICGGERLEESVKERITGKGYKLYNHYGPTEITVDALTTGSCEEGKRITIGGPISNVRCYILDKYNHLAPLGAAGELCISGAGVARGYLNTPELTVRKFVPDPFRVDETMYRTGDLVRWLQDGNIQFLGRMDRQVKIRGYRIELEAIEDQLMKLDEIKEVVTSVREDQKGDKSIIAYCVTYPHASEDSSESQLRDFLSAKLPAYMIPSYFVFIEKIPLTPNGKIDMRNLPDPGIKTGTNYEAPGNDVEQKLVEKWQEVLGIEKIGINDDFFEMGGDSIKMIQISSRLMEYKIKFEIKDLFSNPTIKQLANRIKRIDLVIDQGTVEGEVRLSPIQAWFFENIITNRHHYNQAVIIYKADGFAEVAIRKIFKKLAEHHDALRMIYEIDENKTIQKNRGVEGKLFDLEIINLENQIDIKTQIEREANRIQGEIDLESGPLTKLGLFNTNRGDYLLIVIHHLVIDGVSWRILFEDFAALYRQIEARKEIKLPLKTTSFKQWVEKLYEYSNSRAVSEESEYWEEIGATQLLPLPKDRKTKKQKQMDSNTISFELPKEETEKLLKEVNSAYNTEINDILLSSLGLALHDWAGLNTIAIDLESHGREEILAGVEITRTIGWFTSIYPIIIEIYDAGDLSSAIKGTKEMIRRIPNNGIGYGILKYLTTGKNQQEIPFNLQPEICFNYLGQFEQSIDNTLFSIADISPGYAVSLNSERNYALEILGIISNGRLIISIDYNKEEYETENISELVEMYKASLRKVMDHCIHKEDTELTLSDFSSSEIDEQDIEAMYDVLEDTFKN